MSRQMTEVNRAAQEVRAAVLALLTPVIEQMPAALAPLMDAWQKAQEEERSESEQKEHPIESSQDRAERMARAAERSILPGDYDWAADLVEEYSVDDPEFPALYQAARQQIKKDREGEES